MSNFGPCTRECPKRHYLYCPTCEAWKAEKGQRIEGYDKRVETSDLRQKTAGGAKNWGYKFTRPEYHQNATARKLHYTPGI